MLCKYQEFSKRIHKLANEHNIPARNRAKELIALTNIDVSYSGAKQWFDGNAMPALDRLQKLADFFNVNLKWLMTGEGDKSVSNIKHVDFTSKEVKLVEAFNNADLDTQFKVLTLLENNTQISLCA